MKIEYIKLLKEFFEKHEMRFALIGGLALNAYGYNRFTNDVDFLTDSKNSKTLISYLESIGFKVLQSDSAFSIHTLFNERIDLMYVEGSTADTILNSVQNKKIEDIELPIVSPIHLAMMKAFAVSQDSERIRDIDDIKELYNRNLITKSDIYDVIEKYNLDKYFDFILNKNDGNNKNED